MPGPDHLPDDTPSWVRQRLVEGWRAMSSPRKAALVDAWSNDCRALALTGLRERYPDAVHEELRIRLSSLLLGTATTTQIFGGRDSSEP